VRRRHGLASEAKFVERCVSQLQIEGFERGCSRLPWSLQERAREPDSQTERETITTGAANESKPTYGGVWFNKTAPQLLSAHKTEGCGCLRDIWNIPWGVGLRSHFGVVLVWKAPG